MDDGQLIQLVCTYPHLYDKKKAAFKDARKRMVSWQEIARRLGYSVNDVQVRWKYLRERYVRERKAASVSGGPERGQWEWYQSLNWLDSYIGVRRRMRNFSSPTDAADMEQEDLSLTFESPKLENDDASLVSESSFPFLLKTEEPECDSENQSSSTSVPPLDMEDTQEHSTTIPRGQKRNHSAEIESTLSEIGKCMHTVANRINQNQRFEDSSSTDEDDLFAKSISLFLKNLNNSHKKRQFKKKVFCMMMDVEDEV